MTEGEEPRTTYHAPAEKSGKGTIVEQYGHVSGNRDLKTGLEAFGGLLLVLNDNRQVIYASKGMLDITGNDKLEQVLGGRPGEILSCDKLKDAPNGCGTGKACRECMLVNTILESMRFGTEVSNEASILQKMSSKPSALNMKVHSVPIELDGQTFYVVSLFDMNDTIKKRTMERIFYHDMINTTGALEGYIRLMKDEAPEAMKEELEFVENVLHDLVEEVEAQRQLTAAENGELKLTMSEISSKELLLNLVRLYESHDSGRNKKIIIDSDSADICFMSDPGVIRRILGNMLKNALEATVEGGSVKIGCRYCGSGGDDKGESGETAETLETGGCLEFRVVNRLIMPDYVKHQLFKRAFSTKGGGRGTGTYSMKLLGEGFLGGEVGYEDDGMDTTTFFIRLPLGVNEKEVKNEDSYR